MPERRDDWCGPDRLSNYIGERQNRRVIGIFDLGEEFSPFSLATTRKERTGFFSFDTSYFFPEQAQSAALINVSNGKTSAQLPIRFYATPAYVRPVDVFHPFRPEDGYQINDLDKTPEGRLAKYRVLAGYIDEEMPMIPTLFFRAGNSGFELNSEGLRINTERRDRRGFEFSPEMRELLQGLRLTLSFPDGSSYTAKPWETMLRQGGIQFFQFYPTQTGSLPVDTSSHEAENGEIEPYLKVALGFNMSKIRQMKAVFSYEETE